MVERWYYWLGGQTFGPLSDSGLEQIVARSQIHPATPVRQGEHGSWLPAYAAIQQMHGPRGTVYLSETPSVPQPEVPQAAEETQWLEEPLRPFEILLPFLMSTVFHLTLLILLGLMVTKVSRGYPDSGQLNASWLADEDDFIIDEAVLDIQSPTIQQLDRTHMEEATGGDLSAGIVSHVELFQEAMSIDTEMSIDMPFTREELSQPWMSPEALDTSVAGRLRAAATVGDATGGVLEEIKKELKLGKLLVVWLFDASISLEKDRQRVAQQLHAFLQESKQESPEDSHQLLNAAVAFGATVTELEKSTAFGERVVEAILEAPFDKSGVENMFHAVAWAAREYRKRWKDPIKIVVWTDESGDDSFVLEELIALCRKKRISVSIVGPSAILGREVGTQVWVHAPTGQTFNLPVDRGPDTGLPERFILPYWYEPYPITEDGVSPSDPPQGMIDGLPSWYGGEQLEGIVSGIGPYALVRLATQTGGSYTIFDRPADRGPFQLETMEPYLADYRSVGEMEKDYERNPLRRAIVTVAGLTLRGGSRALPPMRFLQSSQEYVSQVEFRSRLGMVVRYRTAICAGLLQTTETALRNFGPNGMEELYEKETSPRWRAWYDLTRGRLLAVRVRCVEYLTACQMLPKLLDSTTNWFMFESSAELRGNAATVADAEEAFRLLQRCVDANHGTPWEYLARRELDHPLGIALKQREIPAPPPYRPSTRSGSGEPRPPEMPPATVTVTPPKL